MIGEELCWESLSMIKMVMIKMVIINGDMTFEIEAGYKLF